MFDERLPTHERKHTGERPFKCGHPGCDKTFTQLGNLKTHEHIHDEVKPFMCRLAGCGKAFSQLGNLKTHTAKMHPDVNISDEELAVKTAASTSPITRAQASYSWRTTQEQRAGQVIAHFHPYQRRPVGPQWSERTQLLRDIQTMIQYQEQHALDATSESEIRFLESTFEGDRITDVPLLYDIIAESGYEDYKLSFYDPFIGNLCATGRFVDLPIVVTPGGRTGAELSISLVLHKPQLQPPFNFLAPKSTLLSFASAINQIATPSSGSPAAEQEEQILVRTKEAIAIVAPSDNVPPAISRVYHNYVRVLAQIPTSSSSNAPTDMDDDDMGEDITKSIGSSLRTSGSSNITIIKGEDKSSYDSKDPWRSCAWGAHPSQLAVASRNSLDLIDFRGAAIQTCLYTPRKRETICAIQEDKSLNLAPFQTYIATSHQIACIDQRFTKRPVISWTHQMDRAMPCGIKAMDLISEGSNYSTVLTWSKRNADIIAYNVSLGSNERKPSPMAMKGRAQELPSFQSHVQYTNTNSLRDPLKRYQYSAGPDQTLQQAIKPPLIGLAVLPDSVFDDDDDDGDDEIFDEVPTVKSSSVSKFSLVQYAYTGAVYAQEFEIRTEEEVKSDANNIRKNSILSADYNQGFGAIDGPSQNTLATSIAHDMIMNERLEEEEIIDSLLEAAEGRVAPWKRGVKEAQEQADDAIVNLAELHFHVDLDLQSLLAKLQKYMLVDREASTNSGLIDIDAKVEEAMDFINNSTFPLTMFEILEVIKCINAPSRERSVIAEMIQQNFELDPYATTEDGNITHRKIRKVWPITGRKIDTLIRDVEPNVDTITSYLEDLYPLPEVVLLEPDQVRMNEKAITSQLANLTIPESEQDEGLGMDETADQHSSSEGDVWPTQEIRLIRSRTIRRLAQDLLLANTVVIKTIEPEVSSAQSTTEYETFQYLFQNRDKNDGVSSEPKVRLPPKCKSVLDEWKIGESPFDYVYTLPEVAMNDVYISDDEDPDEVREHKERMIQLRQRRERREEKVRSARRNDPGYNVSAGGSLSQPAGVIAEPQSYSNAYGEADDDGMFSLPTVVSASQPASILRTSSLLRSQTQQKLNPKPIATPKNPVLGTSQPSIKSKKDGLSPIRSTFPSTSLASSLESTLVGSK
ncbi:hypothetical protein BGZ80_002694, partial [Entomortierella chlamydospora]